MKKIILYVMILTGLISLQLETIAQTEFADFKKTGKISPDSENISNEPDPKYTALPVDPSVHKKNSTPGNQQPVSALEHGMQIITDIVNKLISKEYNFSLLSSHKYMVNDCLGMKVSSGQFDLRFSNPKIEITNSGQVKIRLEVDKIKFSALKIRIKPRAPDLSDPNPCHFSGKFEIGGEATDLSVTLTITLVTTGLEGSAGFCYLAFGNPYSLKWKIGGLNLRPHPNTLDNMAKEMVEDALNVGMDNILYTKFIDLSKEVMPQYYAACEGAYNFPKMIDAVTQAVNTGDGNNKNSPGNETEKWVISPNNLKGATGRLIMDFPAGTQWQFNIYTMADDKYIRTFHEKDKQDAFAITPGTFRLKLNTVPVLNVPVEKGHDTKLKYGVLDIVSETTWGLYDEANKTYYISGNKPVKLALPVGTYTLRLGGVGQTIVIANGKTAEM